MLLWSTESTSSSTHTLKSDTRTHRIHVIVFCLCRCVYHRQNCHVCYRSGGHTSVHCVSLLTCVCEFLQEIQQSRFHLMRHITTTVAVWWPHKTPQHNFSSVCHCGVSLAQHHLNTYTLYTWTHWAWVSEVFVLFVHQHREQSGRMITQQLQQMWSRLFILCFWSSTETFAENTHSQSLPQLRVTEDEAQDRGMNRREREEKRRAGQSFTDAPHIRLQTDRETDRPMTLKHDCVVFFTLLDGYRDNA